MTQGRSSAECAREAALQLADFLPPETAAEAARRADPQQAIFGDLIGCDEVLQELRSLQRTLKREQARGTADVRSKVNLNFVFAGPPGTGPARPI